METDDPLMVTDDRSQTSDETETGDSPIAQNRITEQLEPICNSSFASAESFSLTDIVAVPERPEISAKNVVQKRAIRKEAARQQWTEYENCLIEELFADNLASGELPGKAACDAAISRGIKRSWKVIKDKVRNEISKLKKA